ncbi:MAG: hypothetical protein SX243_01035 [Acidobacteriota bacterium]|nr:hypothetical protein [Acidobacteriota bacterium]
MTRIRRSFERYIGIDYSGAATPEKGLPGLRAYRADGAEPPREISPTTGRSKYWSRRGLAHWLAEILEEGGGATLVGIDHGFSFPLPYFELHGVEPDWDAFLADFSRHWPTGGDGVWVDDVRQARVGDGTSRSGDARWRRLCERRAGGAKSVFHFDVQGSVAKSTHSGLPWLLLLRRRLGAKLHFWPFDGWQIPDGRSAIAEVYPSLWSSGFPRENRTGDQHDAYSAAAWMQQADRCGRLGQFLHPDLTPEGHALASVEGWILGVR